MHLIKGGFFIELYADAFTINFAKLSTKSQHSEPTVMFWLCKPLEKTVSLENIEDF